MSGAGSTYGKDNKGALRFWRETLSARNLSKDLGVGVRITLDLKPTG